MTKQKSNRQSPPPAARNDRLIPYDEAVAAYHKLEHSQCRDQMRQGELADKVEQKYGDRTLAKFAEAVGKATCTLKRQKSVYRAWEGIQAPGPVSYAVLRALQGHPEREAILKENPEITKRKAEAIMAEYNGKEQKKKGKSNGKAEGHKAWLRRICSDTNKHGRSAEKVMEDETLLTALREVADPVLVQSLAADLKVLLDFTETLLEHQAGDIERDEAHAKEVEAEGVPA